MGEKVLDVVTCSRGGGQEESKHDLPALAVSIKCQGAIFWVSIL